MSFRSDRGVKFKLARQMFSSAGLDYLEIAEKDRVYGRARIRHRWEVSTSPFKAYDGVRSFDEKRTRGVIHGLWSSE